MAVGVCRLIPRTVKDGPDSSVYHRGAYSVVYIPQCDMLDTTMISGQHRDAYGVEMPSLGSKGCALGGGSFSANASLISKSGHMHV